MQWKREYMEGKPQEKSLLFRQGWEEMAEAPWKMALEQLEWTAADVAADNPKQVPPVTAEAYCSMLYAQRFLPQGRNELKW